MDQFPSHAMVERQENQALKTAPPSNVLSSPPIWSSVMHRTATPCGSGSLWTSRAGFSPVDRRADAMHRCELLPIVSGHRVSKAKAAAFRCPPTFNNRTSVAIARGR